MNASESLIQQLSSGFAPPMSSEEFALIGAYVEQEFGIRMPPAKGELLRGRLAKRLQHLHLPSFQAYYRYLINEGSTGDEYLHFADAVSTHETRFFREADHFETLSRRILPQLDRLRPGQMRTMLSAACSTGEEAWTMAMVAARYYGAAASRMVRITGIDLSRRVLELAERAIYPASRLDSVPQEYVKGNFLKSRQTERQMIRIVPELRPLCTFLPGNLLDADCLDQSSFDVIFCRNVLIYFERNLQRQVIARLIRALKPQGFLLLGHSETMGAFGSGLQSIGPAAYQKH